MPKNELSRKEDFMSILKRIKEEDKPQAMSKAYKEAFPVIYEEEKIKRLEEAEIREKYNERIQKIKKLREIANEKFGSIFETAIKNMPIEKKINSGSWIYENGKMIDEINMEFCIKEFSAGNGDPENWSEDEEIIILKILLNIEDENIFFPQNKKLINLNNPECEKTIEEYILKEFEKIIALEIKLYIQKEKDRVKAEISHKEQEEIKKTRPQRLKDYKETLLRRKKEFLRGSLSSKVKDALGLMDYTNHFTEQELKDLKDIENDRDLVNFK